jgi:GNAT superfamily N-acetyltransferase
VTVRPALLSDIPELQSLIADSVRRLSKDYYGAAQIEAALTHVFGVDTQLIEDGTYYVIERDERIAAAGGWSARDTHYGGDQMKTGDDRRLDPALDAARIRAFFVHPAWARQGMGRQLLARCETDAAAAGFRRFTLVATLPGEPFYRALGFVPREALAVSLPQGATLPCTIMDREIRQPSSA